MSYDSQPMYVTMWNHKVYGYFILSDNKCGLVTFLTTLHVNWVFVSCHYSDVLKCSCIAGNEFVVVNTPSFAESISEGDVRWDKGELMVHVVILSCNALRLTLKLFIFLSFTWHVTSVHTALICAQYLQAHVHAHVRS